MCFEVLSVEITPDGGVRIAGTETELLTLAVWLMRAAREGHVEPAYVADEGLAALVIDVER